MNVHDQLAKAILKLVLHGITTFETNKEVLGHVLEADAWVEPRPEHLSDLEKLGLLGRMIALGPCLIEPFSGVPDEDDIRSCLLKQFTLGHAQRRDARKQNQPAPPFPRQWVISTGSPDGVMNAMEPRPMPEWPRGCFAATPFFCFHLIVVRQLPRTPETLLVRLLSGGKTFRAAMHDLAEVPETAPEMARLADLVMHVLVEFRKELNQDQLEEDDMEALRDMDAAFEEWDRQRKAEWRQEVRQEERLNTIRELCQDLDIELTEERLAQLEAWDVDQLGRVLRQISVSHEWPSS